MTKEGVSSVVLLELEEDRRLRFLWIYIKHKIIQVILACFVHRQPDPPPPPKFPWIWQFYLFLAHCTPVHFNKKVYFFLNNYTTILDNNEIISAIWGLTGTTKILGKLSAGVSQQLVMLNLIVTCDPLHGNFFKRLDKSRSK